MDEPWEFAEEVLKSFPSGDVDPIIPGNGSLLCALAESIQSAAIVSITARVSKGFL
jgi:hypothetical protein